MPIITSLSFSAVRVPLNNVTYLSNRTVTHRDYGLVKIRGNNGLEGIGFCYVGNRAGEILPVVIEHLLASVILGCDSHEVECLWQKMYREALLQGRAGVVMRALSIIDVALWDINARSVSLPLHKYLGAVDADEVEAYASGGYYVDGKTPEDLGREMASYVEKGFSAVKMKTGRFSAKVEEDRVKAARAAIGDDVALMLDANNAWANLPEALETVRRLEKYNPAFIEEPFLPDDIDSHARLARATSIPVATGEIEVGRWRHQELLRKEGAAILQTDALVCGGISEWKRIAAMADGFGVPMYPHWFHDVHAPLVAATPNARYVEFFWDSEVLNFRELIDSQLEAKNGKVILRQTPGLGFNFDETKVEKYALKTDGNAWRTLHHK